jgi:hypothetical protein
MWAILLTTTVNVHDTNYLHQRNKEERIQTYLTSIQQWLLTDLPIVVVENSGYTFPELKGTRVEVITFNSMDDKPFHSFLKSLIQLKGKGLYEIHSIRYACEHSHILKSCTHVMKVTGRYFIPSLERIIQSLPSSTKAVRQHNANQCEVVGCRKDYIDTIFDYLVAKDNTLTDHVEDAYEYRMSLIPHAVLPIMSISPTQRGSYDEINTFL